MTPEWQRRQKHHEDVKRALAGDEIDEQGRMRRWHGQKSVAKLANCGHSTVGYENCDCARGTR